MLSLTPELLVEDIHQSINWYQTNLGFEVLFVSPESGTPTFARIKKGVAEIMLFRRAEFTHEIPAFQSASMGGTFVLYLEVKDIQNLWNQFKNQATVIQPLHPTDYGTQEFTIQDCNCYHLIFGQRG